MAGYSGTPLIKKLGIKENFQFYIENAPDYFFTLLGELPLHSRQTPSMEKNLDYIQIFTTSKKELVSLLAKSKTKIKPSGMIWVSWPKKSSKVVTDITEDTIREICLPLDLVDVKVCAISEIWSGLKLVIRKEKR